MTDGDSVRGPPRWKRVLFRCAILAVAWLVLEGVSVLLWRTAVSAGMRAEFRARYASADAEPWHRPNVFWHHDLNPRHPERRLNSHGTRGPEFAVPKPAGEFRVVCVGDSTVEGVGEPHENTFPALLEGRLAEQLTRLPGADSVRVINCGIGSHNSAFSLAYMAFRALHFEPDVVVIKSAYNDFLPYVVPGMGTDYTHAFPEPYTAPPRRGVFWSLARVSHVLRFVALAVHGGEIRRTRMAFNGALTDELAAAMDMAPNRDRLPVYAENVRSMILLCRGRGVRVVLADLPTASEEDLLWRGPESGRRFREVIAALEIELRRVAREEGVTLVATGLGADGDFSDHCHTTLQGNRKVADALCDALLADDRE